MEATQAGDGSTGKEVNSTGEAAGNGQGNTGWTAEQTPDDVSRLARAALQTSALLTGNIVAGAAAPGTAGDGASGLDPLLAQQFTPEQLAAVLASQGYAAALAPLSAAGLQGADNAALNALLLSGGINLATQNLPLAGLGADLSALGAVLAADAGDMEEQVGGGKGAGFSVSSNKQLSSRYRGVCWNKKNKRWQAAINSSGKYLYLGSFTNEDEAARQFDRAAIKLRGKKAKLNFDYNDYVDENGELIDDIILPQGATGKDDAQRGSAGGARRGSKSAAAEGAELDLSGFHPDFMNQAALAALMQQGAWQGISRSGKTAVVAPPLPLEKEHVTVLLPMNCVLEYIVPLPDPSTGGSSGSNTNKSLFGVVYKDVATNSYGAGLWTGYMFKAFGLYASEDAAAQTARSAVELLSEDRGLRVNGGVNAQQGLGLMSGPAGLMTSSAAGFGQDALSLAGLAATGLGGSSARGAAAAAAAANGMGFLGMNPGLVNAGMGGLANVSLAQAAQLAQQAAAEQGLPMGYPPLSVALPAVSSGLQLVSDAAAAAAAVHGAAGVPAAGLDAVGKAVSEAEMQQLMQQLMQQQQTDLHGQLFAQQQQQQQQLAFGGDGTVGALKLANMDMSQLRQQLLDQQQGTGAVSAEDLQQQHGQAAVPSINDVGAAEKRPHDQVGTAAAAVHTAADVPAAAAAAAGALPAGLAPGVDMGVDADPAAKRLKMSIPELAVGSEPTAMAAAAAVPPAAVSGAGAAGDIVSMDLQDALKMLRSVTEKQAGPAAQE